VKEAIILFGFEYRLGRSLQPMTTRAPGFHPSQLFNDGRPLSVLVRAPHRIKITDLYFSLVNAAFQVLL